MAAAQLSHDFSSTCYVVFPLMIVEKPKERPNNLVHMEPRRNRCSCRVRTTVSVVYAVDIDVSLKGREMGDWYFHDGVERVL